MSGVGGLFRRNGEIVGAAESQLLVEALRQRGPDGVSAWRAGPTALVHALMLASPDNAPGQQPLICRRTGCVLTADVRLDNRDELIAQLGLGSPEAQTDPGILLAAYVAWGDRCPERLLGDFAFAVWSPGAATLFCARDHMGMRQLHYHCRDDLFVFGTDVSTVVAHPGVPRQTSVERLIDYHCGIEMADATTTFVKEVRALEPGSWLKVSASACERERYWTPAVQPCISLSDDECAARFRDLLRRAVRDRLRTATPPGCMVSGGLDSTTVAALAAAILQDENGPALKTFSAIDEDSPDCPETRAIKASTEQMTCDAYMVAPTGPTERLAELQRHYEQNADPFDAHMNLVRAVYLEASAAKVTVVLDGAAGDTVLTSGNWIADLLRHGRVLAAVSEAHSMAVRAGKPGAGIRAMVRAVWVAFAPVAVRRARRNLAGSWKAMRLARRVPAGVCKRSVARKRLTNIFLSREVCRTNAEERVSALRSAILSRARGRYDRVAVSAGVEPRDPYLDLRILKFALSLPPEQLDRLGQTKWVLRECAKGLLKDSVRTRADKHHLGPKFTEAVLAGLPAEARNSSGATIPHFPGK